MSGKRTVMSVRQSFRKKMRSPSLRDVVPRYSAADKIPDTPVPVPHHRRVILDNGLTVLLLEREQLPLWEARLMLPTGALHDPAAAGGLLNFAGTLLRDGTQLNGKTLSKTEIAEAVERRGGSLNVQVLRSNTQISAGGLSKHSDVLFELLAAIVLHPTFPEVVVERERQLIIAGIAAKKDLPDRLAHETLMKRLYAGHPYAVPVEGTVDNVMKMTRNDIVERWRRTASPPGAVLAVMGDFKEDAALHRIERLFGAWHGDAVEQAIPEPATLTGGVEIALVNKPAAVQSNIALGHYGVPRRHPDYYSLLVLEQVLFSGMASCFFRVIRAERGLTYNISGDFGMGKFAGPLVIETSTSLPRTGEMLAAVFEIIAHFQETGPTARELHDAKSFLAGSYPLRFETVQGAANELLRLELVGLPPEAISEYRRRIIAVTRNDVHRAACAHIRPSEFRIAVLSDVGQVETLLPALNVPHRIHRPAIE